MIEDKFLEQYDQAKDKKKFFEKFIYIPENLNWMNEHMFMMDRTEIMKGIYKINDRYFIEERYFESQKDNYYELKNFYEVEKKETFRWTKVVEWIPKSFKGE